MSNSKEKWRPIAFKYRIMGMLTANLISCIVAEVIALIIMKVMGLAYSADHIVPFLTLAVVISAFPQVFINSYFCRKDHADYPISWGATLLHPVVLVVVMLLINLVYPVGNFFVPAFVVAVDLAVSIWAKPKPGDEKTLRGAGKKLDDESTQQDE
ncbi:hypothetical protein OZX73_07865 [Bifidobacterium sp. ESL0775]|uniref:hypothetical protein n=1 Tax=Bifidobacterium sp. ESL0775 TaxID=2983230 RepID=UPI0023F80767|nr:hypothetical protein [Bifidobacterium sp. ESL0775]WEV69160.1 hypothetical protein OZX73_07865 [Bifidobacterium sp. ESL0775]